MYVDEKKTSWKEQNISPTWKMLMKDVDLGEPTSFDEHVYLGCTQRECQISKDIADNYTSMFESRLSAGNMENYQKLKLQVNLSQTLSLHGPVTWVERYCEMATKTTQLFFRVATPCLDDNHLQDEENGSVGELLTVCSEIVLKCLYLARIGRPDILWSVNTLVCAVTKWTKACEKRLARLISFIHHTCEFRKYCYVGNTAQQCRLGFFKILILHETLKTQNQHQADFCWAFFGSQTLVTMSWMCKKQTSVSHNSTEAELISLVAGLRMDLLIFGIW